jgi:S-adenosyl-L-methionine hydrolase (adenosine-forming)
LPNFVEGFNMPKTIALMTDFGLEDIYVGVMKGVMRGICADADLIDITHYIPPQSVASGALALKNSVAFFPKGTIFLTIVDPDVGSNRLPIVVQTDDYVFVAPDNGVLSLVLANFAHYVAYRIENRQYALPRVSATFHGRDIFAPCAAYLANGVAPQAFGRKLDSIVTLPIPPLSVENGRISGAIAHIDHFGNIITNIGTLLWDENQVLSLDGQSVSFLASTAQVTIGETILNGVVRAYYEVPAGELLAQIDSTGALEIAIYKGNAQAKLGAKIGDMVSINWV